MSVMMGYGGSEGSPGGPSGGELIYSSPGCGLPPHGLASHDSGIDIISSSDLEYSRSESSELPPTQDIHYQDNSLSDDSSSLASFSEPVKYGRENERRDSVPQREHGADRPTRTRRRRSPPKTNFDINDNSLVSVYTFFKTFLGASSASTVAIDNKIEQAMDLVKSHLMFAVREEVEVLKERIVELMDKITNLECENTLLRQYASPDALHQVKQTQSQGGVQPPLPHHTSS